MAFIDLTDDDELHHKDLTKKIDNLEPLQNLKFQSALSRLKRSQPKRFELDRPCNYLQNVCVSKNNNLLRTLKGGGSSEWPSIEAEGFGYLQLTAEDLERLDDDGWYNDEVCQYKYVFLPHIMCTLTLSVASLAQIVNFIFGIKQIEARNAAHQARNSGKT